LETEKEPSKQIYVDPTMFKALKELADNKKMTVEQYVDFLFKSATTFDFQPEPNEVSIEVTLNPEQCAMLETWLKNRDFIEVLAGPTEGKATLINTRKLEEKNHPGLKDALGGEELNFRVQLLSPFADFIEKYLDFFNEPGSLETFITGSVYEKVWTLHGDLTQFVKTRGHRLELQGWLEKFPERVHGYSEEDKDDY